MDLLFNLFIGLQTSFNPANLIYCFLGVLLGTMVGVLPGLGVPAVIAMLLPLTFSMEPTTSLIMLAGIYYGAQYGGSITAVLVNLPGDVGSIVTALDGHAMARKGQAALALSTAALSSFVAGTIATLVIALLAPALAEVALKFGPADYFSLMVLGLIASVVIAQGSLIKSLCMIVVGLLIGTIGIDVNSGTFRFGFGVPELAEGVNLIPVAMGVFGLAEVIDNLSRSGSLKSAVTAKLGNIYPTRGEMKRMVMPALRGSGIGTILGMLPGGGAMLASFAAYVVEKKAAADPSRFGQGALEGVAAPEAANNAAAQTAFIPLLTLGIPANAVMALMAGALIIHGIQPGPMIIETQPNLFWGLVVSMWIGNLMLLVLNLPLVGLWVKLLNIPYKYLFPAIMVFCAIGVYSLRSLEFDVYMLVLFGLLGYVFRKLDCSVTPLVLGMVLGPMLEEYLRRALLLSRGSVSTFVTHPISATLLAVAAIMLVVMIMPAIRQTREEALKE